MKLYRYYYYHSSNGVVVDIAVYEVVAETPKGYWIGQEYYPYKKWKWVSKTSRKRFAYPTKEQAWESYKIKRTRQIEILTEKLKVAVIAAGLKQPL